VVLVMLFHRWIARATGSAFVVPWLALVALAEQPPGLAFAQEEVSIQSGDNTLKGVLFLPKVRGPHPAVAFVHGPGALDRNHWTSHPELRAHLARQGIASVCWDKPGVGASAGDWAQQSFEDRAREAIDIVKFLQGRPDIDKKRVGLWGISQEGWICPLAASLSPDVSFIILVSAPVRTIEDQDLYRVEHEMRADHRPEGDIEKALAFARRRIELVRSAPYATFDAAQREVADEGWFKDYVHRLGPRDFAFGKKNIAYDGRPVLKAVKCPVLVLVGELDTIVPAKSSAVLIKDILNKAGNKDVTVKAFASADHFMHGSKTGGPRETFAKDRKMELVPDYLTTITNWLGTRAHSP
jgi:pimeloyl-ACP methyl ester carboxylesterase